MVERRRAATRLRLDSDRHGPEEWPVVPHLQARFMTRSSCLSRLSRWTLGAALVLGSQLAPAAKLTLTPSSDGSLYVCDGCNIVSEGAYVLVAGYIQGAIKFPTAKFAKAAKIKSAFLSINAYALPLFDLTVDVYGYTTAEGQLVDADANAGTLLGTLNIPADTGYGEPVLFDVKKFIGKSKAKAPFVAFNLRTDGGTDVFSSLEYNYGQPAQLLVTTGK
jgi:hypothetical protein